MAAAPPPKKFTKNNHGILVLNPAYLEWKKNGGVAGTAKQAPPPKPIDKMTVEISLLQGQDLVAKDRNLFGKKTTSDPYVEIFLLSGSGAPGTTYRKVKLGQTKTMYKTLNPAWRCTISTTIPYLGNAQCSLLFHIWDEDKLSDPDSMGVVKVPLQWADVGGPAGEPKFYPVPANSAKNATGQIELGIKSHVHRLEGLKSYF